MEREVMDFWREICITRASYRGGPWCIGNFMYMSFRAHIYVSIWVSGPTTVCQLTSLCVCVEGGRAREGGKVKCGR
jgi:hypothetical protein